VTTEDYEHSHALVESAAGTKWSVQGNAIPLGHRFLTSISCTGAHTCTAVGNIVTKPHNPLPLAEQERPTAGA
jgi:hypothetical protein